jgi:hypothetical protein
MAESGFIAGDFVVETWRALKFFVDFAFDRPGARSHSVKPKTTFGAGSKFLQVFGTPSMAKLGEGWNRIARLRGMGRKRRDTDASGTTQSSLYEQDQMSTKDLEASGDNPFLDQVQPLTYDLEMTETKESRK